MMNHLAPRLRYDSNPWAKERREDWVERSKVTLCKVSSSEFQDTGHSSFSILPRWQETCRVMPPTAHGTALVTQACEAS